MRYSLWAATILLFAVTAAARQIPSGTVEGRLLASDGKPAVGVRIAAAELKENEMSGLFAAIGRTDDDGKFRLQEIL